MGNDTLSFAERLAQLEARVGKLEGSSKPETPTATNERKKISAKEFLLSKVVQSELQKVLALAY